MQSNWTTFTFILYFTIKILYSVPNLLHLRQNRQVPFSKKQSEARLTVKAFFFHFCLFAFSVDVLQQWPFVISSNSMLHRHRNNSSELTSALNCNCKEHFNLE
uniref:Uncharacterized protein n=1 Tax=Anguilla anguilla TaxID=7936 RepID=A0A0E9W8C1_ANGAN